MVPKDNFHEDEGIAAACLSDNLRIFFLFLDQVVAGYCLMNVDEIVDMLLVTFCLEMDKIHTIGAY